MCNMAQALVDKGYEKGIKQERINIIQRQIRKGYPKEEIIGFLECTEEEYYEAERPLLVTMRN